MTSSLDQHRTHGGEALPVLGGARKLQKHIRDQPRSNVLSSLAKGLDFKGGHTTERDEICASMGPAFLKHFEGLDKYDEERARSKASH